MPESNNTDRSWRASRVRDGAELRRWRPVLDTPSLVLGLDSHGKWVRFVEQTSSLIPANDENLLFFLPLLDIEYADFSTVFDGQLDESGGALETKALELARSVAALALRERATAYMERAIAWLEVIRPDENARVALQDLARSKRGTQKVRQAALALLKRK